MGQAWEMNSALTLHLGVVAIEKGAFWLSVSIKYYLTLYPLSQRALWVECSSMARDTRVQSQVKSDQRLKKSVLDAAFLNTKHYKA